MADGEPQPGATPQESALIPKEMANPPLENSLVFKDNRQVLDDAINTARSSVAAGRDLYPGFFSSWRNSKEIIPVGYTQRNRFDGRLTPAEAVAVVALQTEHSALNQFKALNVETSEKISDALKMEPGMWQHDVIVGIGRFGNELRVATAVREAILNGSGLTEEFSTYWGITPIVYDRFRDALIKDDMRVGENTAAIVVSEVEAFAPEVIAYDSSSKTTEKEKNDRERSLIYGATLASKLYLEALGYSSQELPTTIIKTIDVSPSAQKPYVEDRKLTKLSKIRGSLKAISHRT